MGERYDYVIIGAGMYGLYAAGKLGSRGSLLVIDVDKAPFLRGSYINQARLHNGYHYPRSYSTAAKSQGYYQRFMTDFADCINSDFLKVYAVSSTFSWTNGQQFRLFCSRLGLKCEEIDKQAYFNPDMVDGAYVTEETSFDAKMVCDKLSSKLAEHTEYCFGTAIAGIDKTAEEFVIRMADGREFATGFLLNATYAGVNQIHEHLGYPPFPLKYELCEVVLCTVSDAIEHVGLTVMDGPFFSVMPFGKSGLHSITTVSRTPHITSYDKCPTYPCQNGEACSPKQTMNCNLCDSKPKSAFVDMRQLARKYLRHGMEVEFVKSLFTIKPILKSSEIDDSRPTLIRQYSEKPYFYTVFSGKINTMYDLDVIFEKSS